MEEYEKRRLIIGGSISLLGATFGAASSSNYPISGALGGALIGLVIGLAFAVGVVSPSD